MEYSTYIQDIIELKRNLKKLENKLSLMELKLKLDELENRNKNQEKRIQQILLENNVIKEKIESCIFKYK